MLAGTLIAESVREGAALGDLGLTIRRLERSAVASAWGGQPLVWTVIEFTAECDPDELAEAFAGVLAAPGWYADFHTDGEVFVIFPGRVFRYRRGDVAAREDASRYARSVGVPQGQLDWSE